MAHTMTPLFLIILKLRKGTSSSFSLEGGAAKKPAATQRKRKSKTEKQG
jgi:hypothetical protein